MRTAPNSFLGGHAHIQPLTKAVVRHSGSGGPLRKGHRFPVDRDQAIVSFVIALLNRKRPPAILRIVSKVRVDPINRVPAARRVAHVGVEVGEVVPAVADFHSSSTIQPEVCRIGIGASLAHPLPYAIRTSPAPAVLSDAIANGGQAVASTAFGSPPYKAARLKVFRRSAIALTRPKVVAMPISPSVSGDEKSAKARVSKVAHINNNFMFNPSEPKVILKGTP